MAEFVMKDSGARESFSTGAVRDVREGKGRFDLISPIGLRRLAALPRVTCTGDWALLQNAIVCAAAYMEGHRDNDYLAQAAQSLMAYMDLEELGKFNHNAILPCVPPRGLKRVARVYENGARKYSDRNWEKGMNISRILDSALRHTSQVLAGETDEDHAAHGAWNFIAAMHMEEMVERGLLPAELNDVPSYLPA